VPEHYRWQLQHQLMVSGAELAHLFVFVEDDAVLLEHAPDRESWSVLRQGWDQFWKQYVVADAPPPLTDRDTVVRSDEAWASAAREYIALSDQADEIGDKLIDAKKRLIGLAQHTSEQGAGVAVSTFWKSGNIDYKKLVAAVGVDVEPYRSPARQETRVSLMK
jgi:predicted phage-related endonuclease